VCAGNLFKCLHITDCSVKAPGAEGSENIWKNLTKEENLPVPTSEEKPQGAWDSTRTYTSGEFSESTDGTVYKCLVPTQCQEFPPGTTDTTSTTSTTEEKTW